AAPVLAVDGRRAGQGPGGEAGNVDHGNEVFERHAAEFAEVLLESRGRSGGGEVAHASQTARTGVRRPTSSAASVSSRRSACTQQWARKGCSRTPKTSVTWLARSPSQSSRASASSRQLRSIGTSAR